MYFTDNMSSFSCYQSLSPNYETGRRDIMQVGASVAFDATSMNELRRWNEQYGEGGNRKKSSFGFGV